MPAILLSLAILLLGSAPADAQGLRGRVVDAATAGTVAHAEVLLLSQDGGIVERVTAGPDGRFSIGRDASTLDSLYLYVEALGYYALYERPIEAGAQAGGAWMEVALKPIPIELPGVEVRADRRSPALERVGFYERMALNHGYFLDTPAIEERKTATGVAQLLSGAVPGVRVSNEEEVFLRGMSSMTRAHCGYMVYLDGVLVVPDSNRDPLWASVRQALISTSDLAGVEVYRSPSQVPARYGGGNAGCGVILLWSRRGGSDR